MRSRVAALMAATILLAACSPVASPEPSDPPSQAASPSAGQQEPPTSKAEPSPADTPIPASEIAVFLPPSGQLVERLDVGTQPLYALTIDDGYGKMPFDVMLDEMRARNIKATFFLVALASDNLGTERLEQLVEDGHTIAYHSYAHDELAVVQEWGKQDWLADYSAWEETMRNLLGEERYSQAYRPYARAPYGLFNLPFLRMTEDLDLVPVGWSRDPGDLNRGLVVRPGDIFLLHVRYPDADLMPALLDEIEFNPVSLDELFAAQAPQD